MPAFVLTFPYKGHRPGDVIQVDDDAVPGLVEAGIGSPQGSGVRLRLGRLPALEAPVNPTPVREDGDPRPSRVKKSRSAEEPSNS